MRKGVLLNGMHSNDLGLVLSSKTIGPAIVNTKYIDVPYGKRQDATESLYGEVTYSHREIQMVFGVKKDHMEWSEYMTNIYNLYNGRRFKVIFDDDPGYYYIGRAEFETPERECRIGTFVINMMCDPYKYKIDKTVVRMNLRGGDTKVTLGNRRMPAMVSVEASNAVTIIYNGVRITHSAGVFVIPDLILGYGNNEMVVNTNGTITFTYQEGDL